MNNTHYRIGPCILDRQKMSLQNGDLHSKLSAKVFELLNLFLTNQDNIVSSEQAIEIIWLNNVAVGKRGFTNAVWALRKKFKELGVEGDIFLTLPKVGYQLLLSAEPIVDELPVKLDAQADEEKPKAKSRQYLFVAAAILNTVILVLAYWFFVGNTSPKPDVETGQKNGSPIIHVSKRASITNFEGIEEYPTPSNSGRFLAFQWLKENKPVGLYVRDLMDESAPLNLLTMTTDIESSPAWSNSDDSLAYIRVNSEKQCEVRVKHLITNQDIKIDDGCYYQPYRRVITWSQNHDEALIYAKKIDGRVALFLYDFATKQVQQYTFPEKGQTDYAPHMLGDNLTLAFIREFSTSHVSVLLKDSNNDVKAVVPDKVSILDLDWDKRNNQLYVNYLQGSQYIIERIALTSEQRSIISNTGLPSSIALNMANNEMLISEHISKEYIAEISMQSGKILRRISSSSRDMYGRYNALTSDILFLSNRTDFWAVWKNNRAKSVNLTQQMGHAIVPSISPDGSKYAVSLSTSTGKSRTLYISEFGSTDFTEIDTAGLFADNLSWSLDGKSIYFHATSTAGTGIFKLNIAEQSVVQLTFSNEHFGVEPESGSLLVSKLNESGIWHVDLNSAEQTKLTDKLSAFDFGSFYWQDGALYLLSRTNNEDQIIKHLDGEETILVRYPANSIKRAFGFSPATKNSFISTLKITNEADIIALSLE